MHNEFGETISEEEVIELAKRVRKLPSNLIDQLWYLCHFIISDREPEYKAIRQIDVKNIKKSPEAAKTVLKDFLFEVRIDDVRINLTKLEAQN
jgi:hypothetical protein